MSRSVNICIRVCVALSAIALGDAGAAQAAAAAASPNQVPPGYSLNDTGSRGDFDFLTGAWTTRQRRLKERGVGNTEWKDSPSNFHCVTTYLDGGVVAEESYAPTKTVSGLFLYTFDVEKHQWSLYWVDPKSGRLDSPLVGGFKGERGEFYGEDSENGRPIKVRYSWIKQDRDHARWEQAYSFDDKTWETNWTSDFIRADSTASCGKKAQAADR